ncbi:unnamed protein product [Psylliodes chrysocephalus]|uniref:DUF659 domain-containing protein n=1 Tax=Psylliodes chrysocephalus TaxID=3402493 RepID=A0A9P0CRN1_9CUCU|nr:unnamed protein product [Psylliodes chrysocephala]
MCRKMSKIPIGKNSYESRIDPQAKANNLLAKAIFASGRPLSMVELQFWKDILIFLHPSYALALPTRKTLSTTLLDSHYEVKSDIEITIAESDHLALQLDGWSNIRSEGIINFVVTTAEQKMFYIKILETKEHRHTSEYIAIETVNVLNQYNPNKCIAIITDNAANMKKTTASISEILHKEKEQANNSACNKINVHRQLLGKIAVRDVPLDKNECPSISSLTQVTESVQHSNMILPEAEIPGPSGLSKSPINCDSETETETSSEDSDSDEEDVTDEVNSSETGLV